MQQIELIKKILNDCLWRGKNKVETKVVCSDYERGGFEDAQCEGSDGGFKSQMDK